MPEPSVNTTDEPSAYPRCDDILDEFDLKIDPPIVHAIVPAASAPRPKTTDVAVRTVFELAGLVPLGHRLWRQPPSLPAPRRVQRDGDRIRLVRLLPCETEEARQREIERRARQRPPRPPKGARTVGKKLLGLIGDDD